MGKEEYEDARNFEGASLDCNIRATMCCGVPAWNHGQFSYFTYCCLCSCCMFEGLFGLHRCYLGDFVIGTLCFLTFGCCAIGQIYDFAYNNAEVAIDQMNRQIREEAHKGYLRRMQKERNENGSQTSKMFIPAQPQYNSANYQSEYQQGPSLPRYPPPGTNYPMQQQQQGYYPQGSSNFGYPPYKDQNFANQSYNYGYPQNQGSNYQPQSSNFGYPQTQGSFYTSQSSSSNFGYPQTQGSSNQSQSSAYVQKIDSSQ
ncbi:MAG: hypothetical protein EZS28_030114 [Streblomastix strix]|uniref:TM2 domain-containing protein n=1 Tax=Streblomastix strix TaxID=222440 RepID=A0A5J4UV85_9EUKA|nr:MAG: hypothetical protein EZS28_030114 [Streblomastix strix]